MMNSIRRRMNSIRRWIWTDRIRPLWPCDVVFLGDSLTSSWRLRASFPGCSYVNQGIGGNTSRQMLERFPRRFRPRCMMIWGGINDSSYGVSTDETLTNLARLYSLCREAGIVPVACTVAPTRLDSARHLPRIHRINAWIREQDITVADFHEALRGPDGTLREELAIDEVHLSAQGYAAITPIAAAVLTCIRSQSPPGRAVEILKTTVADTE